MIAQHGEKCSRNNESTKDRGNKNKTKINMSNGCNDDNIADAAECNFKGQGSSASSKNCSFSNNNDVSTNLQHVCPGILRTTVVEQETANCTNSIDTPTSKFSTNMTVMKFGGSSVADSERIRTVAEIIKKHIDFKPCVVLSAIGNTTNQLISMCNEALNRHKIQPAEQLLNMHRLLAKELGVFDALEETFTSYQNEIEKILSGIILLQEISKRTSDLMMSYGERLSVRIVSAYLNHIDIPSKYYDSWDLGICTSSGSGSDFSLKANLDVLPETFDNVYQKLAHLNSNYTYTPVITGFIAKDKRGKIVTLGRSGSDYTASIVGAAIRANEIQIWTDVDGILSCDPRIVQDTKCITHLSYDEASELAYFGAKVIHPMTIQPAVSMGVPLRIKNSYNSYHPGTLVSREKQYEENSFVTALTYKKDITVVDIQSTRMLGANGFLAKVFNIFAALEISVDVIATSEVSVSLTVDKHTAEEKIQQLKTQLDSIATVTIHLNKAIISVVGNNKRSNETLGLACCILKDLDISLQMVSYGASKFNMNFVISDEKAERVLVKLHEAYFSPHSPKLPALSLY